MKNFTFKSNLSEILREMNEGARDTVNETVVAIADDAIARAPVDRGAMAATIVPLLAGEENAGINREAQDAAEKEAQKLRPGVQFNDRLQLIDFSDEGKHRGAVEVLTDYAAIIHNGGGGRSGRPFLEDAGDDARSEMKARAGRNIADRLDG